MKAIRSFEEAKKKIKKHGLVRCDIKRISYRLNDYHKTPVAKNIADKLFEAGLLQRSMTIGHWFETGYKLVTPIGNTTDKHKLSGD